MLIVLICRFLLDFLELVCGVGQSEWGPTHKCRVVVMLCLLTNVNGKKRDSVY